MIKETLLRLGIPSSYVGHKYTIWGVGLVIEDGELLEAIIKGLCTEVGNHYGKSAGTVHRDYRTIINHFWDEGDRAFWGEIIKCKIVDKPTVKQFISALADYEQTSSEDQAYAPEHTPLLLDGR